MSEIGKVLLITGVVVAIIGGLMMLGFGKGWFGKLPGDIHVARQNFSFHFPIVTCLILSAVLTLLMWIFRR